MHGLFDRYAARPTGAPFDNMTLAHFDVCYRTVSGGGDDETEDTNHSLPLENGMGTMLEICMRSQQVTVHNNYSLNLII